jgi:signal transduction histidine kinase
MSPRRVVTEAVETVRGLAQAKNIYLNVEVRDKLPEMVLGDANKVQQIVINLVGNAIKFTDHGGVTVVARAADANHWQISVADTGIGIPSEAQPIIFEPFRQADSSETRKHKGTGLGLTITRRLVTMMGGAIEVRSEVRHGSTFTVTLPRASIPGPNVSETPAAQYLEG